MDVEGRVTPFGILGVPPVCQISNTPQQTQTHSGRWQCTYGDMYVHISKDES